MKPGVVIEWKREDSLKSFMERAGLSPEAETGFLMNWDGDAGIPVDVMIFAECTLNEALAMLKFVEAGHPGATADYFAYHFPDHKQGGKWCVYGMAGLRKLLAGLKPVPKSQRDAEEEG